MKHLLSKKQWLLAVTISITFIQHSSAQSWVVGGNAFTGSNLLAKKVGSTNCYAVSIIANNATMVTYTPKCITGTAPTTTYGSGEINMTSITKVTNPGGGTVLTDTSAMSLFEGSPTASLPVLYARSATSGAVHCYGIKSRTIPADGYGYGIYSEGGRYGMYSVARVGAYGGGSYCYGSFSTATADATNTLANKVGIEAVATGVGFKNYGIYAIASGATNNYAGYYGGDLVYTGSLIHSSDIRLKENVKPYTGALDKINGLEVKTYNFKSEYNFMNLAKGNQIGLISQEVEKIFPNLVAEVIQPANFNPETNEKISDEVNYKGVNYVGFVPVLIEAVKEQQSQIENLKNVKDENNEMRNEISALKSEMVELKNSLNQMKSENSAVSANEKAALEQNSPNPFSEKTIIKYFIPSGSEKSLININSSDNTLLKSYALTGKGSNQLTISSGVLTAGNYVYELVVDGKIIDSKKMILTK